MEHKIIKTENYLLVVSDEQIKKDDWVYNEISKEIYQFVEINVSYEKKIIAHLPLNNYPILFTFYSPNVWVSIHPVISIPLLPPLEPLEQEEDVEKLYPINRTGSMWMPSRHEVSNMYRQEGYNKVKEKFKYTEEDMRKMFEAAIGLSSFSDTDDNKFQYALQSLSQPKMPIGFECETNILSEIPTDIRSHIYDKTYEVPKTTTNGQYQTLWVGEYVYEN